MRPLGRSRHRWENNIEKDLKRNRRIMWNGFIWLRIGISDGLFLNTIMNLCVA
jgi:hypothetical protein